MIRFLLTLTGSAVLTAGTAVAAPRFAPGLAALFAVVLLLGLFALLLPLRRAHVKRTPASGVVEAGQPFRVEAEVRLPFALPAVVELGDGVHQRASRRVRALCLRRRLTARYTLVLSRGVYAFTPVTLTAVDPFGLVSRSFASDIGGTLTVWPQGSAAEGRRLHALLGPGRTGPAQDTVVRSVRPATSEDPMRSIHWVQSAKRGSLHAREVEQSRPRLIALAVRANAGAFEEALSQASSLVRYAQAQGIPVTVDLGGVHIEAGVGHAHFERTMHALAAADYARHDSAARVLPGYVVLDGEGPFAVGIAR